MPQRLIDYLRDNQDGLTRQAWAEVHECRKGELHMHNYVPYFGRGPKPHDWDDRHDQELIDTIERRKRVIEQSVSL